MLRCPENEAYAVSPAVSKASSKPPIRGWGLLQRARGAAFRRRFQAPLSDGLPPFRAQPEGRARNLGEAGSAQPEGRALHGGGSPRGIRALAWIRWGRAWMGRRTAATAGRSKAKLAIVAKSAE